MIKENDKFKIEFKNFSEKVVENYDKYGVILDLFGKYPNIIFDGEKIKIIDLHNTFYDPKKINESNSNFSKEIRQNGISWERLAQGKEYINNLLSFLSEVKDML